MRNLKNNHLNPKPAVIFLVGPTAVGKSKLSIAIAKRLNAEIISLDSMQIYKGIEILSSQPSAKTRNGITHHLAGIIDPGSEFDSAAYRRAALKLIKDIIKRGKTPLFVGGSGLYLSVMIDGIFKGPPKDPSLRQRLYSIAEEKGGGWLYERLKSKDIAAAAKIHPNDLRRIVRALEVFTLTRKPISELWRKRKGISGKYSIYIFGLNIEREKLYAKINARVNEMFKNGLIQEVKRLLEGKATKTCSQAIGYKEVKGYLAGEYGLEKAGELIKKNSRRYAKRQLTWFRGEKRIIWLSASEKNISREILTYIKNTNDRTK